jgi:hypothetical protein
MGLLFAGPSPTSAAAPQTFEKTREICAEQTARVERSGGIPRHLLRAIALAESGRWDADRRASFAWPWTVTAEGEGRFYASKRDAVAAVKALMARDVTNIDVGCMQVNLHYHGGAFRNPEEALDPGTNVAYAARFLKGLFGAARSWPTAAAHYHSTNPEKNIPYRRKVMGLWKQEPRDAAGTQRPAAAPPVVSLRRPVPVDRTRTVALNARFKAARAAAPPPTKTLPDDGIARALAADASAERNRRQPAPRGRGAAGVLKAVAAAAAARIRARKGHPRVNNPEGDFAARRQTQLEAWRRSGTWRLTF